MYLRVRHKPLLFDFIGFPSFRIFQFFRIIRKLGNSGLRSPNADIVADCGERHDRLAVDLAGECCEPCNVGHVVQSDFRVACATVESVHGAGKRFPRSAGDRPVRRPRQIRVGSIEETYDFTPGDPPVLMERISRRTIDANVRAIILLLAVEERMLIMQYNVVIACDIGNAGRRDGNRNRGIRTVPQPASRRKSAVIRVREIRNLHHRPR